MDDRVAVILRWFHERAEWFLHRPDPVQFAVIGGTSLQNIDGNTRARAFGAHLVSPAPIQH
jgi:hypothetical protein